MPYMLEYYLQVQIGPWKTYNSVLFVNEREMGTFVLQCIIRSQKDKIKKITIYMNLFDFCHISFGLYIIYISH